MLELAGPPAFTPARLARRLRRVQAGNPGVAALSASFLHFVDFERPLDDAALAVLDRLLQYGPRPEPTPPAAPDRQLWVVPRIGTISPWSTKATDIARIC